MNRDPRRLADYLAHICQAIERIDQYTEDMNEVAFLDSPLVQDAVIRNLEIIGEASNNIQKRFPSFAEENPQIPLSFAYQMRNALAHGYFQVDLEIVWNTVSADLPRLYQEIQALVKTE
jgi:uncharacterized protein with HEPN domain